MKLGTLIEKYMVKLLMWKDFKFYAIKTFEEREIYNI